MDTENIILTVVLGIATGLFAGSVLLFVTKESTLHRVLFLLSGIACLAVVVIAGAVLFLSNKGSEVKSAAPGGGSGTGVERPITDALEASTQPAKSFVPCPDEAAAAAIVKVPAKRIDDGDKASTCAFQFDTKNANAPVPSICPEDWQCTWIEWQANTTVVVQNGHGQLAQIVAGTYRFKRYYVPQAVVHSICAVFRAQKDYDQRLNPGLKVTYKPFSGDPAACA